MRIVLCVFTLLMIVFAAVQYNDPDGLYWAAIYGVTAGFCALAVARPAMLRGGWARWALLTALIFAVLDMFLSWPDKPGFWHRDVWQVTETAREGMGLMIVVAILGFVHIATRPQRQGQRG